jgi:hypothetical protein
MVVACIVLLGVGYYIGTIEAPAVAEDPDEDE